MINDFLQSLHDCSVRRDVVEDTDARVLRVSEYAAVSWCAQCTGWERGVVCTGYARDVHEALDEGIGCFIFHSIRMLAVGIEACVLGVLENAAEDGGKIVDRGSNLQAL